MIGTVRIRNLEFQGNHGATAAERRSSRRFQIDVDMSFPIDQAVSSDRLTATATYPDVCAMLVEIGSAQPKRLLEALAFTMLSKLREKWPKAKIDLELRKLHPPCPGNPDYTAVRVSA